MNTRIGQLTLLFVTAATALVAGDRVVGTILDFSGPVFLSSASGDAEVRLKHGMDIFRKLYDGQNLRCGPGGRARIQVNGAMRNVTAPDGVVRIQSDRTLTVAQTRMLEVLREYGTPGGGRGSGSFIWSPPDGGAIRSGHLKVRWNASRGAGPLAMALFTEAGERIWSAKGVDAAPGRLQPAQEAEIHRALAQRRDDTNRQSMTLLATSKEHGSTEITFWVLSKQAEERLESRLKLWDEDTSDPLLRAIGHSHTLTDALLYAEAAEECDSALALAPESETVMLAAMQANRRTGNLARARELQERLPAFRRVR